MGDKNFRDIFTPEVVKKAPSIETDGVAKAFCLKILVGLEYKNKKCPFEHDHPRKLDKEEECNTFLEDTYKN